MLCKLYWEGNSIIMLTFCLEILEGNIRHTITGSNTHMLLGAVYDTLQEEISR